MKSKRKNIIKNIFPDIDREIPPEALTWTERSREGYFRKLKIPILLFMLVMLVVIFFIARTHIRTPLLVTTATIFLVVFFDEKIKKLTGFQTKGLVLLVIIVAISGFGWVFYEAVVAYPTISGTTPMAICYLFVASVSVILNPLSFRQNTIFVAFLVTYGALLVAKTGVQTTGDLIDGSFILLGWHFFGLYIHHGWQKATHRAALLIVKQRELIQRMELLKKESFDRDLKLAREIQESISPPTEIHAPTGLAGFFYQKKQGFLGGDWTSSHVDRRGNLYIIMADVTGKGIPAALVVHALQALWIAATSDESSFDPENWVHEVNKTMISLGQNSPQTLTLGLISIEGKRLRYISCGHVPLYVVIETDGQLNVGVLSSRGNILGVNSNLKLSVKSIDIENQKLRWIFGGTDGVFISGTRLSPREAVRIIKDLAEANVEHLLDKNVDDDKILFLLAKNVA